MLVHVTYLDYNIRILIFRGMQSNQENTRQNKYTPDRT